MAVLTWSTFWIWLALVGLAGGGGTACALSSEWPATALGTVSASAVTTDAAAAAAAALLGRSRRSPWRRESLVGWSCIETSDGEPRLRDLSAWTRPEPGVRCREGSGDVRAGRTHQRRRHTGGSRAAPGARQAS